MIRNSKFNQELQYSLNILKIKENEIRQQKSILTNLSIDNIDSLQKWMDVMTTPLGTFPFALVEILQHHFSEDIKGCLRSKDNRFFFIWNDIEIAFPIFKEKYPVVYIDTDYFYKENTLSEKTKFLIDTILPALESYGCTDIRQWGLKDLDYNDKNDRPLDNIIEYKIKVEQKECIEQTETER